MKAFNVYPKGGRQEFSISISIEKFEVKDNKIILFNDHLVESNEGFLAFDKVAAIVPEQQPKREDLICFLVYLVKRTSPIRIFANAFETEPVIRFKYQERDMIGRHILSECPIENIYIASSELVAIIPEDGLVSYRG